MTGEGGGAALVLAALLLAVGCAPSMKGAFDKDGYTSSYGYAIRNQPQSAALLPRGWVIDNFVKVKGELRPKNSDQYVTTHFLDDDSDGEIDRDLAGYTYALRYVHMVRSGAIWLREIPIARHQRHKDLRILMQEYVARMAGSNYEVVSLGASGRNLAIIEVQRFTATIVEQGPMTVAGRPAFRALVDISDVDQVNVAPGARSRRVEVVMLRSPKDEEVVVDNLKGGDPRSLYYPVLLVLGYSNNPEDFEPDLGAFYDLLTQVTIDGKSGLMMGGAPRAEPVPAAAAAPAAPTGPTVTPAPAPAPPAPPAAASPSGAR